MSIFKKMVALITLFAMVGISNRPLEAVSYVTDTGGYAYDESRAVANLAPAIALGTLAIVGIIALAVQNSHDHSSSSSSSSHCSSSSYSCGSSSSSSWLDISSIAAFFTAAVENRKPTIRSFWLDTECIHLFTKRGMHSE